MPVPDPRITDEMVRAATPHFDLALIPKETKLDEVKPLIAERVIAAVFPLVEQAVIERLAGEAGENPYQADTPVMRSIKQESRWALAAAWKQGAAAGVAAERARIVEYVEELRLHDDTGDQLDIGYMQALDDVFLALRPEDT
jgi:hypothetical protein